MSENNEIEAKTILTKETYRTLCRAFPIKHDLQQVNYYFDTATSLLKQHHISCRIRLFTDYAEQTLKVPNSQPVQHHFHEALEINDTLKLSDAQNLLTQAQKKHIITFSANVGIYLQAHFGSNLKLELQTFSKTHRILAAGPQNCELTFDATSYPDDYEDFELEIENSNPNLIKKVLEQLEEKYHFQQTKTTKNQPKIARAYLHQKKINNM
ncbi:CYTH domain-containing protein [Lactobacillus sp. ESL0785]|uniref:CYTH domain-containing protein n=1 Tax=Lactobacillus sp. ESL0785 TaxID=2983232 RepID=UPI0023F94EEB|nr:CYTH domain-containing protein [Lactobacillus sp. ESL0785]WEV71351.1 CYTH domain-containing protein [Lactobacillus sp. ESL0785]